MVTLISMKTRWIVALTVAALISPRIGLTQTSKETTRCPANIQKHELENELSRAAAQAIKAIISGQPEQLMPLFSSTGVEVGVDGPMMSIAAIRKEMANRIGIYCLVFDSRCLSKQTNLGRKKAGMPLLKGETLSYRDYLLRKHSTISTGLWENSERCGGTAVSQHDAGNFDLEFQRTAKGWKI